MNGSQREVETGRIIGETTRGVRTGAITITAAGATNSPQTIPVSITVNPAAPPVIASAAHFVPITPCRLVDTRNANGPFGGPGITGGTSRDFVIPSGACGIPSSATAYSLNVAVVPQLHLGYLTVWPTGQAQPFVATLNSLDGRIKSNAAIVSAGANGAISVFATDMTHVILDVNGYFVPGSSNAASHSTPLHHAALPTRVIPQVPSEDLHWPLRERVRSPYVNHNAGFRPALRRIP